MAQIAVTALSQMLPEDVTSDYNMIVFTSDGDTNQVAFEAAVAQANVNNGCECLHSASLTITSAQVLALNSTPLTIVAAQGVGMAIELLSWSAKIENVTTPYATNTTINLTCGGIAPMGTSSALLLSSVDKIAQFARSENPSAAQTQMIENAALQITSAGGDPTTGDGDITVYVLYRVITL